MVDFNKNCEDRRRKVLGLSGIPIYYHRCTRCRFLFTVAFDDFTQADFANEIYNEGYALVDPDYADARPRNISKTFVQLFGANKTLRILDYGGGNGMLGQLLREAGFAHVETYDPYSPEHQKRPGGQYDLITCFEVVEHTPRPKETFEDINSLLKPQGLLLFSTLLQPPDIDALGMTWWYLAPRNGHISLFTAASLAALLRPLGLAMASSNHDVHFAYRTVPPFAAHILQRRV